MTELDGRLEWEALQEFIQLEDCGGNLGDRVSKIIEDELTQRQAELIRLYYANQCSMTEIAHRLGISPSTVSRTIKRGRVRIKKYLKYNGRAFAHALND